MHLIKVSSQQPRGVMWVCTIMTFKIFVCVCVCDDAPGLLLINRWHSVQLACAICVGQQCLPIVQLLPLAVVQWSRSWPADLLACWFADLLDVNVNESDGLPLHVCMKLESLERAAEDLVNVHSQAV